MRKPRRSLITRRSSGERSFKEPPPWRDTYERALQARQRYGISIARLAAQSLKPERRERCALFSLHFGQIMVALSTKYDFTRSSCEVQPPCEGLSGQSRNVPH